MNNKYNSQVINFFLLVLLQVLVFDNIYIHGFINIYIYPLFILLLPISMPHWALIIIGMLVGSLVGIFNNTPGLHSAATIFIAFFRPYILNVLTPRSGYDDNQQTTIYSPSTKWYITYIMIGLFLHHSVLFIIESLKFLGFFFIIAKIFFSVIFSTIVIILYSYIFQPKNKRR